MKQLTLMLNNYIADKLKIIISVIISHFNIKARVSSPKSPSLYHVLLRKKYYISHEPAMMSVD